MSNFDRYLDVVAAIKNNKDGGDISEEVTSIMKEALLDKQELYNKAVDEATKKINEDNLTSNEDKIEKTSEEGASTTSEENNQSEVAHAE